MLNLNYGVSTSELRAEAKAAGRAYSSKKVTIKIENVYALFIENGMNLEDCRLYADGKLNLHNEGIIGDHMVVTLEKNYA